ncbi:DUF6531 domain-containing protein [Streptomyces sp. H39-S7]|uniref:DUF6531 domain-containing protein n=1 Tax=Streptomyces sp. H39-S7 TaxID=3004357 RepID=UPI0022AED269|nr:DUF6531 domain-containing protein [Streptomyces sp. H39-S7]MCZ4123101.1 DUF6531 domain-containing protein [Streptomyces sp. H39-S7]
MGNRPTDWHILDLDRDPVPGDPYEVKELARKLGDFADDVSSALRSVRGLNGDNAVQDWAGLAGDEYRKQFGDLPNELGKLEKSYRLASGALDTYWPKLETAQADADRALAHGRTARHDLDAAKSTQTNADDWVKRAGDKSKEYQADPKPGVEPPSADEVRTATRNALDASNAQKSANSAVHDAQGRLDAAKELAAQAAHLRDTAASTAEHALHEASDAGIKNKHWWEKAVDWVADHWDEIVAVCKVIVAVLGILVMIIGGPLAWLVLAAALVVLADTLIKYAQGKASLWDVAFAALDCIPGFKGLTTAGGLLKMAKNLPKLMKGMGSHLNDVAGALRGLRSLGTKGLDLGKRGLDDLRGAADTAMERAKSFVNRCKRGDPIDMVSGEMLLSETDVVLPGALPLVLERTHVSTYHYGRWFGPTWASTLDERLELDDEGVVFAAEDGMLLFYPVPRPGTTTLPLTGPRWPMTWDGSAGGQIRITSPTTGLTHHFDPLSTEAPARKGPLVLPIRAISDRNGHRIDFDYDTAGAPVSVRHSGGYHLAVVTRDDRVVELRLLDTAGSPADEVLLQRYGYDAAKNLTHVTDASGQPFVLTYDAAGRVTSWTDRNDSWYRFVYDDYDRCIRGLGSDDFLNCAIVYDTDARTTEYTDSLGHTTTFLHDERFQLVAETDPLGHVTRNTWDDCDRLLTTADALGRTTRYDYDDHGRLVRVVRADGTSTSTVHDDRGLASVVTHPDGARWLQDYDSAGNLASATDPAGYATRYLRDERGVLTEVIDAFGGVRQVVTDPAGLPIAVTDALGVTTRYRRDAFGRVTETLDPVGGAARTGWSAQGRPVWRTFPDGATERWEYDGEGNMLHHTDAAGFVTRFEYTHFDLPSARIGADGSRHEFAYDTERRLIAVTDPQQLVWTYTYDPAGRMIREVDFNGRALTYRYNPAGELQERTNSLGQTITFTRDGLGQIIEQRSGDQVSVFDRDASGRLLRAANAVSEVVFERDPLGRVLTQNSDGRVLASSYDALGRRVERLTPAGVRSTWAYDAANQPTSLNSAGHTINFRFDAAGREAQRKFDSGVELSHSWDANHRLAAQALRRSDAGGSPIERRSYRYRADGYPTSVTDLTSGMRQFTLDPTGRITAVEGEHTAEAYAFDAAGRPNHSVATRADALVQGDRGYEGTLLRRAGRTTYDYDAQGRVVRRSRRLLSGGRRTWQYTWDAEDRLTDLNTPDGQHWQYQYDALGRRVAKQRLAPDGSVAEQVRFTWDDNQLVEETGQGRSMTWDWDPVSCRPLSQIETREEQDWFDRRFYAIVAGLVGAPEELLDSDGAIVWRASTDTWGTRSPDDAHPVDCPLRFPGQYHDVESGLHYNVHRYYDPETSRYQSPDPLGLDPAPDPHGYVSNPLIWADPLGLAPGACRADVTWGGRVRYGALDHLDRPTTMYATIGRDMIRGGTPAAGRIRPPGFTGGMPFGNQARGHLLGNQLGGSGDIPENLVTLVHNPVNTPVMRGYESEIRAAVQGNAETAGQTVQYSVTPVYDGDILMPTHVILEAHGSDGFHLYQSIANVEP